MGGVDLEKGGFGERKVVRVIKGGVVDVGVDIGKGCGRLGEEVGVEVREEKEGEFLIGGGFGEGLRVLREEVILE